MKEMVGRLDLKSYYACSDPGCRERHASEDSPPVVQVLQRPAASTPAAAAVRADSSMAASAKVQAQQAPTPQAPKELSQKDIDSVRKAGQQAAEKCMTQQMAKLQGGYGKN